MSEYIEQYDVELITDRGTYHSVVDLNIIKLMMQTDYVTVRNTTAKVYKTEITDNGFIKFHGNAIDQ